MIIFNFKSLATSDLPLLFEWLALPHVAQWWREIKDYKKFAEKYGQWIEIDDVGSYIIMHENQPIGFVGWAETATDPIRKEAYPERTYGMDVFIADLDYLGKGYAAELIKQFIHKIIMPMNPSKIIIDPELTNERAIHVYEKVGFKKTKIVQGTDGTRLVTAQLMELDLHNS